MAKLLGRGNAGAFSMVNKGFYLGAQERMALLKQRRLVELALSGFPVSLLTVDDVMYVLYLRPAEDDKKNQVPREFHTAFWFSNRPRVQTHFNIPNTSTLTPLIDMSAQQLRAAVTIMRRFDNFRFPDTPEFPHFEAYNMELHAGAVNEDDLHTIIVIMVFLTCGLAASLGVTSILETLLKFREDDPQAHWEQGGGGVSKGMGKGKGKGASNAVTRVQLQALAKRRGVTGVSRLTKEQLLRRLKQ